MKTPTETLHLGTNADLIAAVVQLYVPKRKKIIIADVTYGRGAFWSKTDTTKFQLLKTDKYPVKGYGSKRMDFCALTYKSNSLDIVVLDPPYIHSPGRHMTDDRYNNAQTDRAWRKATKATHGMYHSDIIALYRKGMKEAYRVLRSGGLLWVKCKDEISGGKQCRSMIEIWMIAVKELGFIDKDLFVLGPTSKTSHNRWDRQLHARKTHSYLWIFLKK